MSFWMTSLAFTSAGDKNHMKRCMVMAATKTRRKTLPMRPPAVVIMSLLKVAMAMATAIPAAA